VVIYTQVHDYKLYHEETSDSEPVGVPSRGSELPHPALHTRAPIRGGNQSTTTGRLEYPLEVASHSQQQHKLYYSTSHLFYWITVGAILFLFFFTLGLVNTLNVWQKFLSFWFNQREFFHFRFACSFLNSMVAFEKEENYFIFMILYCL